MEDRFPGCAELGLRNIIKLLAMGHSCIDNCSHWLNEVGDGIELTYKNTGNCSYLFLGFGEKENLTSTENRYYSKFKPIPKSPWEYFSKLWKDIYNDKDDQGNYKYRHLLTETPSKDVFLQIYQVIAYSTGVIGLNDTSTIWNITPGFPAINFSNSIFGKFNIKNNVKSYIKIILENLIGLSF